MTQVCSSHLSTSHELTNSSLGQITTRNGALAIVLEQVEDHGLQFRSGMLQSWNKFCFTTGYIEGQWFVVTPMKPNLIEIQLVLFFPGRRTFRDT